MERTFVAIKPDAVQRGLISKILERFEQNGFRIIGLKLMQLDVATAEKHYAEHYGKSFFKDLVDFITSGPIVAIALEGDNAVKTARKLIGSTNPQDANPGTIRADFGQIMGRNIIHGSDSIESAKRELSIFFRNEELIQNFNREIDRWIFE